MSSSYLAGWLLRCYKMGYVMVFGGSYSVIEFASAERSAITAKSVSMVLNVIWY